MPRISEILADQILLLQFEIAGKTFTIENHEEWINLLCTEEQLYLSLKTIGMLTVEHCDKWIDRLSKSYLVKALFEARMCNVRYSGKWIHRLEGKFLLDVLIESDMVNVAHCERWIDFYTQDNPTSKLDGDLYSLEWALGHMGLIDPAGLYQMRMISPFYRPTAEYLLRIAFESYTTMVTSEMVRAIFHNVRSRMVVDELIRVVSANPREVSGVSIPLEIADEIYRHMHKKAFS